MDTHLTKWNSTYLHEVVQDSSELKDDVDFINEIINRMIAFNID